MEGPGRPGTVSCALLTFWDFSMPLSMLASEMLQHHALHNTMCRVALSRSIQHTDVLDSGAFVVQASLLNEIISSQ